MSTLLPIPKVSQLTTTTDEKGEISSNAQMDCTAAGIDTLCRYVLGTPENSVFNPDHFKDASYGDAYTGGTAAIEYVHFCQSIGVHLHSVDASSYAQVISLARHYIRDLKQPCVFTRDDPYVDHRVHPDWTHVCIWYGEDDNGLTAHDPYINAAAYKSDQGWIDVLRSNQLWVAEKIVVAPAVSPVPHGWTDANGVLTAPNGVAIVKGFRDWVLTHNWDKDNWALEPEKSLNPLELSNPSLGAGSWQPFRKTVLEWTPKMGVFESWVGQELAYLRPKSEELYSAYKAFMEAYAVGQAQPGTIADAQAKQ